MLVLSVGVLFTSALMGTRQAQADPIGVQFVLEGPILLKDFPTEIALINCSAATQKITVTPEGENAPRVKVD